MSPEKPIEAYLIIDDYPINASYWRRFQCRAFGFPAPEVCEWSRGWPAQSAAHYMPVRIAEEFADTLDEFDIRGKFTVLPCPAGLGRIDQSVREIPTADLKALLDLARKRFAPRFDISLEVLTHSMALDIATGGLMPHTESAWVSYMSAPVPGRQETLCSYIRHGFEVHRNAGFTTRCMTLGGMPDVSGITGDKMVHEGHNLAGLAQAMATVSREFLPSETNTTLFAAVTTKSEWNSKTGLPQLVLTRPDGTKVFDLFCAVGESLLALMGGQGDVAAVTDGLITPDLQRGRLVDAAESGAALSFIAHAQSLTSLNTGLGLKAFREAMRRLRARYGKRLVWRRPTDLVRLHAAEYDNDTSRKGT